MTFYRRNLPHLQRDAKPHFVTFVTKQRRILQCWERNIVLECLCRDHPARYDLHAAVVMPDHVHMILTPKVDVERREVIPLFEIMKTIKSASAHKINKQLQRHGAVWQEESFDHVLRSSEHLDAQTLYVLENPVRKGLVRDWHEYPWIWKSPFASP